MAAPPVRSLGGASQVAARTAQLVRGHDRARRIVDGAAQALRAGGGRNFGRRAGVMPFQSCVRAGLLCLFLVRGLAGDGKRGSLGLQPGLGGRDDRCTGARGYHQPSPWHRAGTRPMGGRRVGGLAERLEIGSARDRPRGDHEPARARGREVVADVLFIVNPASGAGRAGQEWAGIASWLSSTGLSYEAVLTTRPLEATEIAERAVRQSRPAVVAVGGDGTLNEVVNGFFHNGAPIPTTTRLAMLPLGTGGDFRRTLKIPLDPKAAIEILRTGVARRLDAGCVSYRTADGGTGVRHFINIADAGLGGEGVHRVNNGGKRLGPATFKLASFLALMTWKNKPMN